MEFQNTISKRIISQQEYDMLTDREKRSFIAYEKPEGDEPEAAYDGKAEAAKSKVKKKK